MIHDFLPQREYECFQENPELQTIERGLLPRNKVSATQIWQKKFALTHSIVSNLKFSKILAAVCIMHTFSVNIFILSDLSNAFKGSSQGAPTRLRVPIRDTFYLFILGKPWFFTLDGSCERPRVE